MENTKVKRKFVIIEEREFDKNYNDSGFDGESTLELNIEYENGNIEKEDILVKFDEDGITNEKEDIEYIYPEI